MKIIKSEVFKVVVKSAYKEEEYFVKAFSIKEALDIANHFIDESKNLGRVTSISELHINLLESSTRTITLEI